jgi:hypothetical protein
LGVSGNPEIVATDQLTLLLKRCPYLAVSGCASSQWKVVNTGEAF